MDDIVFVKEFSNRNAEQDVNEYLDKGWKLLNVGTKIVSILKNGQAEYMPCYVLGANRKQYDIYKKENMNISSIKKEIRDFLDSEH